jgi:hypothetical protein
MQPYGPFRTELAYTVRRLERETGIGYSERAAEAGRNVAHLRD